MASSRSEGSTVGSGCTEGSGSETMEFLSLSSHGSTGPGSDSVSLCSTQEGTCSGLLAGISDVVLLPRTLWVCLFFSFMISNFSVLITNSITEDPEQQHTSTSVGKVVDGLEELQVADDYAHYASEAVSAPPHLDFSSGSLILGLLELLPLFEV